MFSLISLDFSVMMIGLYWTNHVLIKGKVRRVGERKGLCVYHVQIVTRRE